VAKRREPKVINQCRDGDVNLPLAGPKPKHATCGQDLTENQLYLLAEHAARNHRAGLEPADYCYTFFGFHPTPEDREHIAFSLRLYAESWKEHLEGARIGWAAQFEAKYGVKPKPPVILEAPR
jgi:hypothetical protein